MKKASKMEIEKDLIERAINEETRDEAFNELYKTHAEQMRSIAWSFLKNEHDVDDAVQQAFIKAHRGMSTYIHNRPFSSWLSTICANLCIDMLQDKKRLREVYQPSTNNGEPVDNSFLENFYHLAQEQTGEKNSSVLDQIEEDKRLRKIINECLESLSEKHRTILHMVDFDGWPYQDCATVLNIPIGTVMSRVSFARQYFIAALAKRNIATSTKALLQGVLHES